MFEPGDHISIQLLDKDDQPPYQVQGWFITQDDTFIGVEGTVGDSIGKLVAIPLTMVKVITRAR